MTTTTTTGQVPVGLSTVVGLAASAILGVVAAVAAIIDGDHSEETIGALVSAAFVLYGIIRSRGEQAAALAAQPAEPAAPLAPVESIGPSA